MKRWTPIIPKSVLFVMLNSNEAGSSNSNQGFIGPESWSLDVLIKPNEKLVLIIMVDAVFLLLLGLIIIILHLLEKAEDRKDSKSFDYF